MHIWVTTYLWVGVSACASKDVCLSFQLHIIYDFCLYLCMIVSLYICVCVKARLCVYVCVCTQVCMYVCVYVYMHAFYFCKIPQRSD